MTESPTVEHAVVLPGRLGNPEMTLGEDPRADRRMLAAMAPLGLDVPGPPLPVTATTPREELLAFIAQAETAFDGAFASLFADLPPVEGVVTETRVITGSDGNDLSLYLHMPARRTGPLPGIVHFHGGGMVMLTAADVDYRRWRDELAAAGLVVIGVEFRNGGGKLGPHPFPAGLDDCGTALRWAHEHREELGLSKIVASGESGGGNLTLAVTHRARQQGWLDVIDGVYAQCPYISNAWTSQPAELPSLRENDGYLLSCTMLGILGEVYDPGGAHAGDPACWPYQAAVEDLAGMPPHVISVNELDPLRDEGLAYYRKLSAAGVPSYSRTVNGTCHAGDVLFRKHLPDAYAATIRDIKGFAESGLH